MAAPNDGHTQRSTEEEEEEEEEDEAESDDDWEMEVEDDDDDDEVDAGFFAGPASFTQLILPALNPTRTSQRNASQLASRFNRVPSVHDSPALQQPLASQLAAQSLPRAGRSVYPQSREHWHRLHPPRHGRFVPRARMLESRELNLPSRYCNAAFSNAEKAHLLNRFVPGRHPEAKDRLLSRGYISKFSSDGSIFVGGFQDKRIRLYDFYAGWRLRKDVEARLLRWTITDTSLTDDGQHLVYTSINPFVHLVGVGGEQYSGVDSIANVTDVHECLELCPSDEQEGHFGIWSVKLGKNRSELIAGASDSSMYAYDMESKTTVARARGHKDEVNAVAYTDETDNVILSGSDDSTIKVWDRREMGRSNPRPVGVILGHTEGLTHIDPRNDGRYFISNAKDQTLKLWDLRMSVSTQTAKVHEQERRSTLPTFTWDYRSMQYPADGYEVNHPHDQSMHTYRGHKVLKTLIRCYWSPPSTGQRYIYTGSHDGSVRIFDTVTGKQIRRLPCGSRTIVRDCAWHPYEPNLSCVTWNGEILSFDWKSVEDTSIASNNSMPESQPSSRHGHSSSNTGTEDDLGSDDDEDRNVATGGQVVRAGLLQRLAGLHE